MHFFFNEVLPSETNLECVFRILPQTSYAGIYRSKVYVTMCSLRSNPWTFQAGEKKFIAWGINSFHHLSRAVRLISTHQYNIQQARTITWTNGWKPFMNQDASAPAAPRCKPTALKSRVKWIRCIHITHILSADPFTLLSSKQVYIMHYLLAITYTDQHLVQCELTASRLPSEYQKSFHGNYRQHGEVGT